MTKKLDDNLLALIRGGVYIILFTPLLVTKYLYFPFISTKVFIFKIIIEIIGVIWLGLIFRGKIKMPSLKNPLVLSALVFLLAMALSVIFGEQWYRSFWGTMERGGGLFSYLHYFVFWLILITVFRQGKEQQKLLDVFLFVGLAVGLAAVTQKLNLPVIYETGISRATGSTGNAAHLASFLIFSLFLSAVKILSANATFAKRLFYAACALFSAIGILLSQTRGAAVGVGVGLVIWLLLSALKEQSKKARRLSLIFLITVVLVGGVLFLNRESAWVKKQPLLNRFVSISLADTTVQQRWQSWQAGWQGFKEKPLLGWGIENYHLAFNKYLDASYYSLVKTGTYFDRAHNIVIELLTTTGIIGFLAYFAGAYAVLAILFKARQKFSEHIRLSNGLIALLVAYFVQNLFVFDTVVTYLSLVVLLAYIYSLYYQPATEQIITANKTNLLVRWQKIILIIASLSSVYCLIWLNIRPAFSGYYIREAMNEANKRPNYYYRIFSDYMRRSLSFGTLWDAEYIIEYLSWYKDILVMPNVDKKAVSDDVYYIVNVGEKYLPTTDKDAKFLAQLAGFYEIIYDYTGDEKALIRAEEHIKNSLALSPNRIFHLHMLAQIYEFNGRDQEAIETLERARDLNADIGETYWSLALVYSKINQQELAIQNTQEAIKRKVVLRDINNIVEILPIFEQARDYESLAFLYETAAQIEPRNIDWRAKLAAAYAVLGQKEQAVTTAQEIIDINPAAIEQVNNFINEVNAGKYDIK